MTIHNGPQGLLGAMPAITTRMTRPEVSRWLAETEGLRISPHTLAGIASKGQDGCRFEIWGGRAMYAPDEVREWARARLLKPTAGAAKRKSGT